MAAQLNPVLADIEHWNHVRNTPTALNFLTSGTGFTIHKDDFEQWKNQESTGTNPVNLHCYFAINQFELIFYLIDDLSDRTNSGVLGKTLVKKDFTRTYHTQDIQTFTPLKFNSTSSLCPDDAKERIVSWSLSAATWFEHQIDKKREILRVIVIPFRDFEELFDGDNNDVFAFFALKNYAELLKAEGLTDSDEPRYNIELILSQMNPDLVDREITNPNTQEYRDVTFPSPPFIRDFTGFNLLSK
jgi:hypothetical protein